MHIHAFIYIYMMYITTDYSVPARGGAAVHQPENVAHYVYVCIYVHV